MAYEGGGKMKNKRGAEAPKPYSKNTSLMGRMKDSVKDMLAPSWLVDLVSSVKKKTPPNSPPPQAEEMDEDADKQNHGNMNSISVSQQQQAQHQQSTDRFAASSSMPHIAQRSQNSTLPLPHTPAEPSTVFSGDRLPYAQFNKYPNIQHPVIINGEESADVSEFSLLPDKKDYQRDLLQLTDNKIAQLRKEFAGSITPSRELEAQQHQQSAEASTRDDNNSATSFLWTTDVKPKYISKPQSAARGSKPAFNVSVFGSSILSPESSSLFSASANIHESSYYAGKTTFGGAASAIRSKSRGSSPYQSPAIAKKQVTAKPSKSGSRAVTSSTAKKILDTLESMSTPLNDAKKMPSYSSSRYSPLTFTPSSYRRRSLPARALGSDGPPVRNLQTPTMAAISENLHRPPIYSLPTPSLPRKAAAAAAAASSASTQQSTYNAGESSSGVNSRGGKMKRDRGGGHYSRAGDEEPAPAAPDLPTGFTLPASNFGGFSLPVPPAVSPVQGKPPSQDASSPLASGFKFSSPIAKTDLGPSITEQYSPPAAFTFSSPISMSVTSTTSASTSSSSTILASSSCTSSSGASTGFTFGSGSAVASSSSTEFSFGSTPSIAAPATSGLAFNPTSTTTLKLKPQTASSTSPFRSTTQLKSSGSVIDALRKAPVTSLDVSPKNSSVGSELKRGSCLEVLGLTGKKNPEESNGQKSPVPLSSLFKPQPGTWECSMCMIRNKAEVEKCVACETPKPGPPPAPVPVSTAPPLPAGVKPLSELFKKPVGQWECSVCMLQNKPEADKCPACETPKPKVSTTTSAHTDSKPLSELFKKPAGQWECSLCMVQNKPEADKCACCETPNPKSSGASVQKPDSGGLFGKPSTPLTSSAVSSSTSFTTSTLAQRFKKPEGSWECDTCMVQNKAGHNKCIACETPKPGAPKPTSKFTSPGGFKFGPSGGFQFGTSVNNNNKDSTADCIKPTTNGDFQQGAADFKFGSSDTSKLDSKTNSGATFGSVNNSSGFKFGSPSSKNSKDEDSTMTKGITFGKPVVGTDGSSPFGNIKFGSTDSKSINASGKSAEQKDLPDKTTEVVKPNTGLFGQSTTIASAIVTTSTATVSTSLDTKSPPSYEASFALNTLATKPTVGDIKNDKTSTQSTSAAPASSLFAFGKTSTAGAGKTGEAKPLSVSSGFAFKAPSSSQPTANKADSKTTFGSAPGFGSFSGSSSKAEEKKSAAPVVTGVFGSPGFSAAATTSSAPDSSSSSASLFGSAGNQSAVVAAAAPSAAPFSFSSTPVTTGSKRTRDTSAASEPSSKLFSNGEGPLTFDCLPALFAASAGGSSASTFGAVSQSTTSSTSATGFASNSAGFDATAASTVPGVFKFGANSGADAAPSSKSNATPFAFTGGPSAPSAPFNFTANAATTTASFNFAAGNQPAGALFSAGSANNNSSSNPFSAPAANNPFSATAPAGTRRTMKKAVRKIRKP